MFKLSKTFTKPFLHLLGLSISGYIMATIASQTGRLTNENILLSQVVTLLFILINAYQKHTN